MGIRSQSGDAWHRTLCRCACILWILAPGLNACGTADRSEPTPTSTPAAMPVAAVPTYTPTPVIVIAAQAATPTPAPTTAPRAYVVQAGDTLIGIGQKLGIDPGELQRANSISDPRSLQVGQRLTVPAPALLQPLAGPALPRHSVRGLRAHVDGLGRAWLLGEVVNESDETVEQVNVETRLLDGQGGEVARGEAQSYRYLTPPGGASPFMAAMVPGNAAWSSWQVAVSGMRTAYVGLLYTELEVSNLKFGKSSENVVWISGRLRNAGSARTREAEALVTLYSQGGEVLAVRVLPSENPELEPGDEAGFQGVAVTAGDPAASVKAVGQGIRAE